MSFFLSMMEAELAPGFRFHPKDDELVCDYLIPAKASSTMISSSRSGTYYRKPTLVDVDLNKVEPWDLPVTACVGGKEWYFFSLRDRKYATGQRTNRATVSGYWKATGKDRIVRRRGFLVGMRKTLVFYKGRAPKGKKTEWVMHEFRVESTGNGGVSGNLLSPPTPKLFCKEDWVLCRVFYKSRGVLPKMNASSDNINTVTDGSGTGGGDEDSGSSSLLPAPLTMDTYISFDQTHRTTTTIEGRIDLQVPCFSNVVQNNIPTINNGIIAQQQQQNNKNQIYGGNVYNFGRETMMMNYSPSSSYMDDQLMSCDKKLMKAVLDQLTSKIDHGQVHHHQLVSESHHDNYYEAYNDLHAAAAGGSPSIWSSFPVIM